MKFGLPISAFLHSAALFGGLVLYSGQLKPLNEGRIIPVDIISVAERTNVRAAVKVQKPEQIKTEAEPMRLENPADNAEETVSDDRPETPSDTPQPPEKVAEILTPSDTEPAVNSPETESARAREPDRFSLDSVAALIDKSRSTAGDKNQQDTLQSEKNTYEFAKSARAGSGEETALTLSEMDALQSKMYQCWRMPADAPDPEKLAVRVKVALLPDGTVQSAELLDRVKIAASSNGYLKVAAQRAVRAVSKCAPYDFLPVDKYNTWKRLELNFRPPV